VGNILIADGQRESRARLQELLENQGVPVITTSNLATAVPLAKTDQPTLVFLNVSRSREEGWTVCRDIRRSCPRAKIVLYVEGSPTEEDAVLGLEAGADEVIPEVRDLSEISRFLEAAKIGYSLTCPGCNSEFRIEEMPVPGARIEAQCPECQFLIGVLAQGPEAFTVDSSLNGRAKILVVEDTKFFRAYLTDLLTEAGFQVVTAQDGVEALEYLSRECPDLVITDVLMPRMHGFELCRKIKDNQETASVPVIMMTQVYTRTHHEIEARGVHGADDYITKPFTPADLFARIWRFLPHTLENQLDR
jgi:twitching motility two-component system response regulator PilH